MPALVNRSVGSSAGISEEDGTRRCPRSSKNVRNRSLTSVDFIPAPDNLRNLLRRKSAAGQGVEHAAAPQRRRQVSARGPEPVEGPAQSLVFPLARPFGAEGSRDGLPREPPHLQLPLDPRTPVTGAAAARGRARRRQVVQKALPFEGAQRFGDGLGREALLPEHAGQLGAAPGPDREEPHGAFPRRRRGPRIWRRCAAAGRRTYPRGGSWLEKSTGDSSWSGLKSEGTSSAASISSRAMSAVD